VSTTAAQESAQEVNLLKAVFIYNFAKFTRWPEEQLNKPEHSITLCSYGNDFLAENLHMLNGKRLQGRSIVINHLHNEVEELDHCHVLYFARSSQKQARDILESISSKPILTISEIPGFARLGGMIELTYDKDKIRFIINLKASRLSGLEISARLLDLATVVNDEGLQ
jgi:hypothetical protein